MAYFDQAQFDVRCAWGMPGVSHLAPADVIVIVDVLSFCTTVDVALGRGATILPYRWRDASAEGYARERDAELAQGRGQPGARYTLAPSSLTAAPAGLRLVLPSPNGSQLAFAAGATGAGVYAASLRNAAAVAHHLPLAGRRVNVIPAGERWPDGSLRPALEDLVGAGAVIAHLPGHRSPEAETAVAAFTGMAPRLREVLLDSTSGRELAERGFAEDVEIAACLDTSTVVAHLVDGVFVDRC